jgi:pyridoxine 4-dehydrogenase
VPDHRVGVSNQADFAHEEVNMSPQTTAELPVGHLGFGAMRITGQGIWGPPRDESEAITLLRRVVDKGVTFIDTADSYGPGISEMLIAKALYPYPAGLVVATKGGLTRPGADRWVADCRPEHLRHACADSLRRLRLERVPSRLRLLAAFVVQGAPNRPS